MESEECDEGTVVGVGASTAGSRIRFSRFAIQGGRFWCSDDHSGIFGGFVGAEPGEDDGAVIQMRSEKH